MIDGAVVAGLEDDGSAIDTHLSPIDAVITWVDGNDPVHRAKRLVALRSERSLSPKAIPGGRNDTRFVDSGELRYCIHAIRRFMPWIRTIYLVTDNQRPDFLDEAACARFGIVLVDHTEIFGGYEQALPTFNSRSIETVLHRIPGLAEQYIYFNDDVFVLEPCSPKDFFSPGGVILRGNWKRLQRFGWLRLGLSALINNFAEQVLSKVRSMHVLAELKGALLAGMTTRFLEAAHTPHPMQKETVIGFFNTHAGLMEGNIRHRFRHMDQFLTVSLAAHLEIARGTYGLSPLKDNILVCFNRDSATTLQNKIQSLHSRTFRFLCLQGLERARPDDRKKIVSFLEKKIGPL